VWRFGDRLVRWCAIRLQRDTASTVSFLAAGVVFSTATTGVMPTDGV
jgi:hypothetical protein